MQSLKDLKKRIRSVSSIEQITKAMEVVSMTKMRKSQQFALQARPYAIAAFEMFDSLLHYAKERPALLTPRPIRRKLLVVVTSDKGLVGSFNESVLRRAGAWIAAAEKDGVEYAVMAVGRKGRESLERKKVPLVASFHGFGDYTSIMETVPAAERILDGFFSREWDSVDIVYTHFRTTLKQETAQKRLLPATKKGIHEVIEAIVPEFGKYHELARSRHPRGKYNYEFVFEPSPAEILDALVPSLVKIFVHHVVLESNASEHSARMVTMKSASENAKELVGELNLQYNKARQAGITQELSEVIAGQSSV